MIPDWFCLNLPYCDECEKYIKFIDGVCYSYQSHRLLDTCNYCQKDFKTFDNRQVRCSSCCQSIEQKLKTLPSVYNIKRRKQEFIIDDL